MGVENWLHANPDRESAAALETIQDCRVAKVKARLNGCMDDWVHFDRLEAKAEAFLRH
jgi:hypothetical protein